MIQILTKSTYNTLQMLKSQIKPGQIKLQIQINQHVKFGKIAYKHDDLISKVFHDLKRIKILPQRINQYEIKFLDKNNVELNKNHQFQNKFDSSSDLNLIKIIVPENSINLEETAKRADEYIKSNKQKKRVLKQMSQAEHFVKNLRPIFSLIHQQKYNQISTLFDSQQYSVVINQYSNEHKQIVLTNKVYESIINQIIQNQSIDITKLKPIQQTNDLIKDKIYALVKKYNRFVEQEVENKLIRTKSQSEQKQKIIQLKEQIQELNSTVKRNQKVIKDLQREKDQEQRNYYQYQRDTQQKISILQQEINHLKLQLTKNQSKFQRILTQKQKQIERMAVSLPKQIQISQHLSNYFKYFINKNLVLNQVALHPVYSYKFIQALSKNTQSQIKGINLLYKYQKPSVSDRFHQHVDFKNNIFVIAQTKQGRVFGGFSNLPFDPHQRKHSPSNIIENVKSFLFNIYKNQINFFPVKPNYDSISYEQDFIIFGNEEICIDRYEGKVESLFVNYKTNYLHYNDVNDIRSYFLSDKQGQSIAQLSNYQIYQILT